MTSGSVRRAHQRPGFARPLEAVKRTKIICCRAVVLSEDAYWKEIEDSAQEGNKASGL